MVGIDGIMRHLRIFGQKRLEFCTRDHGIHEETAGIALYFGVGQFGITDIDNGLTQLLGSRFSNALTLQFSTNISIIQMGMERFRELIFHTDNEILILPILLETTLTIAIFALGIFEDADMACSYLNSTDATNQILSLGTIGSYVLYRTGSHIAWNERKVLGTIESHLDTLCHHIIEHLTTATRQAIAFATNALASGVNHNAFEIAGEEKIASSTYYNIRRRGVAQNGSHLKRFLLVSILQETGTLRLNTKGIV